MPQQTSRKPHYTITLGRILKGCGSNRGRNVTARELERQVARACRYELPAPALEKAKTPDEEVHAAMDGFACTLGTAGLTEQMLDGVLSRVFDSIDKVDKSRRGKELGNAAGEMATIIRMMKEHSINHTVTRSAVANLVMAGLVKAAMKADAPTRQSMKENLAGCQSLRHAGISLIETLSRSTGDPSAMKRVIVTSSLVGMDRARLEALLRGAQDGNGSFEAHGVIDAHGSRSKPRIGGAPKHGVEPIIAPDSDGVPEEAEERETVKIPSPEGAARDPAHDTFEDEDELDGAVPFDSDESKVPPPLPAQLALDRELFSAIGAMSVERAEKALGRGADVDAEGEDGHTPIVCAVIKNDMRMIGVLGEWKADVNKQDKAGWTPLMFAAVEGNLQAVILLSSLGADPTIENRYHETACTLAGKSGRPADIRERIVRILKYDKSLENGGSQR
jgi:hypothetical protein